MSRGNVAGELPLMRDGRESAKLRDFDLQGDTLEFLLEVPLPEPVSSGLSGSAGALSSPVPSSPADGVLRISWAPDAADEVALHLPGRSQTLARAQVRYGQTPREPLLEWTRCFIEGTKWLHHMRFQPLPEAGALAFRFSSRPLDVTSAVGVVAVSDLRSRII